VDGDGTILGVRRLGNPFGAVPWCSPGGRGWLNPRWVPIQGGCCVSLSQGRVQVGLPEPQGRGSGVSA
jgi:hypothetical protein